MPYSRTSDVILTLLAYNHPDALPNSYFAEILDISEKLTSRYTHPLYQTNDIQPFDQKKKRFWMLTNKGWMRLHIRKYTGVRVDEWKCRHCNESFDELPDKRIVTDTIGFFCDNCSEPWDADVLKFTVWKSAKPEFKAIYEHAPDEHKTVKRRRLEKREALINPRPS